ncbi:MAG: N-acetylmuramoyl-L-alanine amidase [Alphaproteobacteria bacterium]|nr:N-acetylmuramoyl-L-alanine amidase [Alphaproteobacteria bacterium]
MRWCLLFFIFFSLIISSAALAAGEKLSVENIRTGVTSGEGARIVLDLNQKTDFRAFALDQPYRIVLDLPATEWKTYQSKFITNNIVKAYRSGVLDDGLTRVIFDIKNPALIANVFPLAKDDFSKDRLVIDLQPASLSLFNARKGDISGNSGLKGVGAVKTPQGSGYVAVQNNLVKVASLTAVPALTPLRRPPKQYTVVIDAGHGGGDPGAMDYGVKEKDITLRVAAELKRQMEETGRYRVVLTRDKDVYIKLHERVDISRRVDGDLFISIHADKIGRKGVRGVSIYTLSETASDAETARLAEDENNSGFVAGVDLGQESQDVADILLDLAMREKMNESNMFAKMLRYALLQKDVRLLPKSHRSAGFAVLKAPDVPSVLVEIGFLSNPEEAKLLGSSQFQSKIASSMLDGVDAYFRKIQSLQAR